MSRDISIVHSHFLMKNNLLVLLLLSLVLILISPARTEKLILKKGVEVKEHTSENFILVDKILN